MWRLLGAIKIILESNQIVRVPVEKTPKVLGYRNEV